MTVKKILWRDYYKNNFVKIYKEICEQKQNIYSKRIVSMQELHKLVDVYIKCHDAAITLMEYFLCYNGLFHYESREIIRAAYKTAIISDGETWIDTNALCIAAKVQLTQIFAKKLVSYYEQPYFNIFTDLNNYFKERINGK